MVYYLIGCYGYEREDIYAFINFQQLKDVVKIKFDIIIENNDCGIDEPEHIGKNFYVVWRECDEPLKVFKG